MNGIQNGLPHITIEFWNGFLTRAQEIYDQLTLQIQSLQRQNSDLQQRLAAQEREMGRLRNVVRVQNGTIEELNGRLKERAIQNHQMQAELNGYRGDRIPGPLLARSSTCAKQEEAFSSFLNLSDRYFIKNSQGDYLSAKKVGWQQGRIELEVGNEKMSLSLQKVYVHPQVQQSYLWKKKGTDTYQLFYPREVKISSKITVKGNVSDTEMHCNEEREVEHFEHFFPIDGSLLERHFQKRTDNTYEWKDLKKDS